MGNIKNGDSTWPPSLVGKFNYQISGDNSNIFFEACLGGFSLGNTLSWHKAAREVIQKKLVATEYEMYWVSTTVRLGATSSTVFMALVYDFLGRKYTMSLLAIPFMVGWNFLASAKSLEYYCAGRFITGFCGGAFSIAAPIYVTEIAHKEIRGQLAALFYVCITAGDVFAFVLARFKDIDILTLPCSFVPLIMSIFIVVYPDTPVFLLMNGNEGYARKSLQFFRGDDYDIEPEFKELQEYVRDEDETYWDTCKKAETLKGSLLLLTLHILHHLTGLRVVYGLAKEVFLIAKIDLSIGIQDIIISTVNMLGSVISVFLVDKLGRKFLWILSFSIMSVCLIIVAVYFTVKCQDDRQGAWLPLVSVLIYLFGFHLGVGPLPWLSQGEFIINSVKTPVGAIVVACNWFLSFLISWSYVPIAEVVGMAAEYWTFAFICGLGVLFVLYFMFETNQKSLLEINLQMKGK